MPSKKKKYNARFPAGRIKKIMQTDEEVGKVAQAVPVIISKALEMFIESLLKKSMHITQGRNAKTLTPSHMKQCILSESRFDFLKDLVKSIPDASIQEDNENNALAESNVNFGIIQDEPAIKVELASSQKERRKEYVASTAGSFHPEQSSSTTSRTPVIQFGPKVQRQNSMKFSSVPVDSLAAVRNEPHNPDIKEEPKLHVKIDSQELLNAEHAPVISHPQTELPSLVPLSTSVYGSSSTGDNLCIDEDYDN